MSKRIGDRNEDDRLVFVPTKAGLKERNCPSNMDRIFKPLFTAKARGHGNGAFHLPLDHREPQGSDFGVPWRVQRLALGKPFDCADHAAASRRRRPASRKSASDSRLGAGGVGFSAAGWSTAWAGPTFTCGAVSSTGSATPPRPGPLRTHPGCGHTAKRPGSLSDYFRGVGRGTSARQNPSLHGPQ